MVSTVRHAEMGTSCVRRPYPQRRPGTWDGSHYWDVQVLRTGRSGRPTSMSGRARVGRSSRARRKTEPGVRPRVSAALTKPAQPSHPGRRPVQPGEPLGPGDRVALRTSVGLQRSLPGWLPDVLAIAFLVVMALGGLGVIVGYLSVGTSGAITGALR